MTRPDIDVLREACDSPWALPPDLLLDKNRLRALLAHVDAIEAALRAAVDRCHEQTWVADFWTAVSCSMAPNYSKCPACRAALALLNGRDDA